jgi:hypothetical protein
MFFVVTPYSNIFAALVLLKQARATGRQLSSELNDLKIKVMSLENQGLFFRGPHVVLSITLTSHVCLHCYLPPNRGSK